MCIHVALRLATAAFRSLSFVPIVLAVTVAGGSVAAAFQERELSDEQLALVEERIQEARERLNLTDEQTDQVVPILRAGFEALLVVLEEHGIDIENRSGERNRPRLRQLRRLNRDLEEVRERTVEQLSDVLSDEQIEVYRELQEERRQALRARVLERR